MSGSGSHQPIWLLIDVSNWAHPDLHATGSADGALSNIVRRVETCQERIGPERVVFCFDSPTSHRKGISPTYKANRDGDPPRGLHELLAGIVDYALQNAHDTLRIDGFEADDVIATLARIAVDQGRAATMASADKDLHQCLVRGAVNQLKRVRRVARHMPVEFEVLTAGGLFATTGIEPSQWVDYQALVGDATDNITGCDSVGPKTAAELLRVWKTLDAYYADPSRAFKSKLTASHHRKLAAFRDDGLDRARRLVTLRRDVPVPAAWHEVLV